jgi:hypothetical protein
MPSHQPSPQCSTRLGLAQVLEAQGSGGVIVSNDTHLQVDLFTAKIPWVLDSNPSARKQMFTYLVKELRNWPHCELLLCYPALRRICDAPVGVHQQYSRLRTYRVLVMSPLHRWRPRRHDSDIARFTSRKERHHRRARPLIGHDLGDAYQPLRARQVLMMPKDEFDALSRGCSCCMAMITGDSRSPASEDPGFEPRIQPRCFRVRRRPCGACPLVWLRVSQFDTCVEIGSLSGIPYDIAWECMTVAARASAWSMPEFGYALSVMSYHRGAGSTQGSENHRISKPTCTGRRGHERTHHRHIPSQIRMHARQEE